MREGYARMHKVGHSHCQCRLTHLMWLPLLLVAPAAPSARSPWGAWQLLARQHSVDLLRGEGLLLLQAPRGRCHGRQGQVRNQSGK